MKWTFKTDEDMKKEKILLNIALETWDWPFQRINSDSAIELECPHGVGHGGMHGCDGCCGHPSYKKALKLFKQKKRKTYK